MTVRPPYAAPQRTLLRSAFALAALLAATVHAAPPATASPEMMHLNMTAAERDEIINEATNALAARQANAAERAQLAVEPGRRNVENSEQKRAVSGRQMQHGSAVGRVVGTELMSQRRVTVTADGEHLESCSAEGHTHDAKTTAHIARALKEARPTASKLTAQSALTASGVQGASRE